MAVFWRLSWGLLLAAAGWGQEHVFYATPDGGRISADLSGSGERGVVLAPGGAFLKESWAPQGQRLVTAGFRVLAIDFRGRGLSRGPRQEDLYGAPLQIDILGGVQYLRARGAQSVSVVGASFGGSAAADASIAAQPGVIQRLVLLAAGPNGPAGGLHSATLFLVARADANTGGLRLPGIRRAYEQAPEPKKLVVVEGSAHAQFLFQTDQSERVMQEILQFLR